MELFDEMPEHLPKSQTCVFGLRNTLEDSSQTFDVRIIETWPGGADIAIPCFDEDAAIDVLKAIEMGGNSGLVEVLQPE